ncbi:hypothetical protein HZ994_09820 [Akkermansiaceae bacterium]|nr:hypothetical protein HZ994_09820 [Akkermansiaceae bacterium]
MNTKPTLIPVFSARRGFALVITLTLLVLLSILALGMLSLSSIALRSSSQDDGMAQAKANARLALMVAIGELQKEMGPDMRVSGESSILDTNESTESIDGVAQSRWLGSYDSWGTWLNATYARPGSGSPLNIQDTYSKGRTNMFRRWLLSLPRGMETNLDVPRTLAGIDPSRLALMVGEGSLGTSPDADEVTKAYLVDVGTRGRHAWWIGAENQRAKATLAKNPRNLAVTDWESSQGDTAEVGVGTLDGLKFLDDTPQLSERLVSSSTLEAAGAAKGDAQQHFFDITTHGKGVITSVRTGQLKMDLSLLFEKPNSNLPEQYRFNASDIREPSIRPMSPELRNRAIMPNRQFASWTNMRHFYRMYRTSSDATPTEQGTTGSLEWKRGKPSSAYAASSSVKISNPRWNGSNHYWRTPILAKLTLVYSLLARPAAGGKYDCLQYYSPVFTFWNPYNTQLTLPSGQLSSPARHTGCGPPTRSST